MLIRRATKEELGLVASLLQTAGRPPLPAALLINDNYFCRSNDN
jgi:hypothetical protein